MTFADKLLFICLIVFVVGSFFFVKELIPSGNTVEISVDNKTVYTLDLNEDRAVTVKGPRGESLIEIKNSRVHIKDSPCPSRLCVNQGWIERGAITCVPNRVVVSVTGSGQRMEQSDYDAVTK